MSFLLDTNIISAHLKRPVGLSHRFSQHSGRLHVPTVVVAECYVWAFRRSNPAPALSALETLLRGEVRVVGFDLDCALEFGRRRAEMLGKGLAIDPVDMRIASVALARDFTLVTHNTADFESVPGLRLEDWLAR